MKIPDYLLRSHFFFFPIISIDISLIEELSNKILRITEKTEDVHKLSTLIPM